MIEEGIMELFDGSSPEFLNEERVLMRREMLEEYLMQCQRRLDRQRRPLAREVTGRKTTKSEERLRLELHHVSAEGDAMKKVVATSGKKGAARTARQRQHHPSF